MEFTLFGKSFGASGGKNQTAVSDDGEIYTLTERRKQLNPVFRPFLNPTFGNAMNQNVSFSGTPEIIHNGASSTEWDAIGSATWDFSTGDVITLTAGNNADAAIFSEETPTTVDMNGFTALTMDITLTTYSDLNNTLLVEFDNAGVVQGNFVALDDYIDTSAIAVAQNVVIPKADMGLATNLVDGFTITVVRLGGGKPTVIFDNIQLEQTGSPATFTVTPINEKEELHFSGFRIDMVGPVLTSALAWDKILNLTKLPNGLVFRRVQKGITNFAVPFRQMADFTGAGAIIVNTITDGTDTMLSLEIDFFEPIILTGAADNNFLSFTVNDDLSALLKLTMAARGAIVENPEGV